MHTYIHRYILTYIRTYVRTYIHSIHIYIPSHPHPIPSLPSPAHTIPYHTSIHAYVHTYITPHYINNMYIHIYMYIHMFIYYCVYITLHSITFHTYKHTYRQTDTHSIPYHIIPYHTIPYRIPYQHTYIPFQSIPFHPYLTIRYHTIHTYTFGGGVGYLYLHLLADTQANVHTLLPPIHYHIPPPQGGRDRQRHTWFNIVVKLYVVPCSAFTLVFGPFDMRPAIMKGGFAMKMWTVCLVHKIVPQRLTVCGKPWIKGGISSSIETVQTFSSIQPHLHGSTTQLPAATSKR